MAIIKPETNFIESFIEEADRKYSSGSFQEFLLTKIRVRSGAEFHTFSYKGHEYLRSISKIIEKSKDFCALKAGQVAMSTLLVAESFYRGDKARAMKMAWFFPDDSKMKIFVQDRVYEMIDQSPYISKRLADTDSTKNVQLIKYGQATIAFRSTQTKMGVKTFDADAIYLDELDEQNVENVVFADDRIDHSTIALRRSASQPSIEDFGIHAEWKDSKQFMWLVKCPSCGNYNNLVERFIEKPGSIFGKSGKGKTEKTIFQCEKSKCNGELNPQKGEYVAKYPDRLRDGVQVSQFFVDIKTPEQHRLKWEKAKTSLLRKNYYISTVGWPYSTDEEKPITQSILESIRGDHGIPDGVETFTYMGADQGDTVHMLFGEPTLDYRIKIYPAKFSVLDEEAINKAIMRYRVYSGIIDAMPNKSWSVKTAKLFPENIRIQYFSKKFSMKDETLPTADELDIEVLNVNRDDSLEDTVEAIKAGLFILPDKARLTGPDLELAEELDLHLKMLVKERKEDDNGKPQYSYKKRVPNHYGMALNSLRLAFELGAPQ